MPNRGSPAILPTNGSACGRRTAREYTSSATECRRLFSRYSSSAHWKPAAANPTQARLSAALVAPIAWLVCLTLGISVAAGPVYGLSMRAATQLLDANGYVRAALGAEGADAAR